MSDYSENNPADFVEEVEKFSGSILNKKAELIRIYEESIKSGKEKIFEDLTFTAKYLRGLMRVLQKGTNNPDVQSLDQIKKDFSDNVKKIIKQLKEITAGSDEQLQKHFKDNYYQMSQESLININEFLADLEWTKLYLNDQKRQKKN
jgi:hypothetical protein